MDEVFAGYPAPFIRDAPGGRKIQQLIWGDWVRRHDEEDGDWVKVSARRETGWMRTSEIQQEQLLEINFVDVGQGDGTFVVTPNDRFLLVDAGEADNMIRFLSWRFNLRQNPSRVITFPNAVITHPDQDHYRGFSGLFESVQFRFGTVYHNGIVERAGELSLGPQEQRDGRWYLTEILPDIDALRELLSDPAKLRRFGGRTDDGKTKNGHSVVLRFVYRNVRILLGADLNIPAQEYLLAHYTQRDPKTRDEQEQEILVAQARRFFEADVAKACHHGSSDFSSLFLRAVNPLATVISSGDDEPHAHPRPDALGTVGKHGRGPRPLIFSTELARSSKDDTKDPGKLRAEIERLIQERIDAGTDVEREAAQRRLSEALARLERSVAVYGLINLRTDGTKVLLAQKLERPRPSTKEEWDVHLLEPGRSGALEYVSKH